MKKILVLCTGNSCRSQMAEGYLRYYGGKAIDVYSAGLHPHGVNSKAIEAMAEDGIDISNHTSNSIDEYLDVDFDFVITVCNNAKENCPYFPTQAERIHSSFPDPAMATGSEEQVMKEFRSVRELIKKFCIGFLEQRQLSRA